MNNWVFLSHEDKKLYTKLLYEKYGITKDRIYAGLSRFQIVINNILKKFRYLLSQGLVVDFTFKEFMSNLEIEQLTRFFTARHFVVAGILLDNGVMDRLIWSDYSEN